MSKQNCSIAVEVIVADPGLSTSGTVGGGRRGWLQEKRNFSTK